MRLSCFSHWEQTIWLLYEYSFAGLQPVHAQLLICNGSGSLITEQLVRTCQAQRSSHSSAAGVKESRPDLESRSFIATNLVRRI